MIYALLILQAFTTLALTISSIVLYKMLGREIGKVNKSVKFHTVAMAQLALASRGIYEPFEKCGKYLLHQEHPDLWEWEHGSELTRNIDGAKQNDAMEFLRLKTPV